MPSGGRTKSDERWMKPEEAGGSLELPGPRAAVALPGTGMLLSYHPGHE